MTREEAITVLENIKMDLEHYRDLFMYLNDINSVIERLKQPPTLAEFLGWEEGQEYEYRSDAILMLDNGKLYYKSDKWSSGWCNYTFSGNEIEELRQAKKVEQPRYLLQTDLISENGIQYLSFDKRRRKYFMGALMTSKNVQQKFTDSEISKIKSITRFVEFCEKVEVK